MARENVLSDFKSDLANVADGVCVVKEINQRDMCENMTVAASQVMGGDVD